MTKELWLKKNNNECKKCHMVLDMDNRKEAHAHHKTSKTKVDNMANLWGKGASDKEAKKCICLCKTCHTELHSKYGRKVTIKQTMEFIA